MYRNGPRGREGKSWVCKVAEHGRGHCHEAGRLRGRCSHGVLLYSAGGDRRDYLYLSCRMLRRRVPPRLCTTTPFGRCDRKAQGPFRTPLFRKDIVQAVLFQPTKDLSDAGGCAAEITSVCAVDCSVVSSRSRCSLGAFHGWQERSLFIVRNVPKKSPFFKNAWRAYSEHVGSCRQKPYGYKWRSKP